MGAPAVKSNPAADALSARLEGLKLPQSPDWASGARQEALARLSDMGLPGRRDEYWRFTRPDTLTQVAPVPAAPFDHGGEAPVFSEIDRLRLIFTDGVFDAEASDDLTLAGVEIIRLEDAEKTSWAKDLYGDLEARGQKPVARPLAALNTAFAPDGVLIRVT